MDRLAYLGFLKQYAGSTGSVTVYFLWFNAYSLTYNNANELTQMTNSAQGTTVSFTYDAWGRTATQTVGARSATYSYKYGSKLAAVTSNLLGEQNVTFQYGGDQKRRSMTTGGVTKKYNWDMSWNVINEEDASGTLARSYTHNPQHPGRATLAHVDGTSPATGAYNYYLHDHLGSPRSVINQTNDVLATYQYTPYGDILSANNFKTTTHLYTGHDWNTASGLYFAPFRFYSPQNARWLTRDPLGLADGPNVYAYTSNSPISREDPTGLCSRSKCKKLARQILNACVKRAAARMKAACGRASVRHRAILKVITVQTQWCYAWCDHEFGAHTFGADSCIFMCDQADTAERAAEYGVYLAHLAAIRLQQFVDINKCKGDHQMLRHFCDRNCCKA